MPDTKESREEIAQYYQSVSRIDQGFGKLMKMLQETGKANNTIVIYISDNGMAFPGAKTTVHEPGIKLPCIIKDPTKGVKNATSNAMISWVDLTPTILDMAKIDFKKEQFHGKSFNKIIEKSNPEGWDEIYASHTFHEITMYYPMRVVRSKNYKLIWNIAWRLEYPFASDLWASSTWQGIYRNKIEKFGPKKVQDYLFRPEFELYDLEKDPDELNNLSKNKDFTLEQTTISPFEIQKADEVFITNAIIGVQPVTSYKKKKFTTEVGSKIAGNLKVLQITGV